MGGTRRVHVGVLTIVHATMMVTSTTFDPGIFEGQTLYVGCSARRALSNAPKHAVRFELYIFYVTTLASEPSIIRTRNAHWHSRVSYQNNHHP